MPAAHPVQLQYSTDSYLHDFLLQQDDEGTPLNVTGVDFSVIAMTDEFGVPIPTMTGTATVLDGPSGHVRVAIPQADIAEYLGTKSSVIFWFRLRNDDSEQTIIAVPVEVRP